MSKQTFNPDFLWTLRCEQDLIAGDDSDRIGELIEVRGALSCCLLVFVNLRARAVRLCHG